MSSKALSTSNLFSVAHKLGVVKQGPCTCRAKRYIGTFTGSLKDILKTGQGHNVYYELKSILTDSTLFNTGKVGDINYYQNKTGLNPVYLRPRSGNPLVRARKFVAFFGRFWFHRESALPCPCCQVLPFPSAICKSRLATTGSDLTKRFVNDASICVQIDAIDTTCR